MDVTRMEGAYSLCYFLLETSLGVLNGNAHPRLRCFAFGFVTGTELLMLTLHSANVTTMFIALQ